MFSARLLRLVRGMAYLARDHQVSVGSPPARPLDTLKEGLVPTRDFLLLCQSAVEHGNLTSILGAGITQIQAEMLPVGLPVTVVARFYWDQDEIHTPHVVTLRVEHPDGERLANIDVGVTPLRPEDVPPERWHHRESRSQRLVLTIPLEVRRDAAYEVQIVVDGAVLMATPLEVTTRLPQL